LQFLVFVVVECFVEFVFLSYSFALAEWFFVASWLAG
jgi:hypothetical protein